MLYYMMLNSFLSLPDLAAAAIQEQGRVITSRLHHTNIEHDDVFCVCIFLLHAMKVSGAGRSANSPKACCGAGPASSFCRYLQLQGRNRVFRGGSVGRGIQSVAEGFIIFHRYARVYCVRYTVEHVSATESESSGGGVNSPGRKCEQLLHKSTISSGRCEEIFMTLRESVQLCSCGIILSFAYYESVYIRFCGRNSSIFHHES
eukprot:g43792.t1